MEFPSFSISDVLNGSIKIAHQANNHKSIKLKIIQDIQEDWSIMDIVEKCCPDGWEKVFENSKPELEIINEILIDQEKVFGQYFPLKKNIFKVFQITPLKKIKVVIFGQDPYHTKTNIGEPVAQGLAFSISQDDPKIPPSLRNIFKEIHNEYPSKSNEEKKKFKFLLGETVNEFEKTFGEKIHEEIKDELEQLKNISEGEYDPNFVIKIYNQFNEFKNKVYKIYPEKNKQKPLKKGVDKIFGIIQNEREIEFKIPQHGDLTSWSKQGVFLINTCLTVRPHNAGSHKNIWFGFVKKVIEAINNANPNCIYVLWGKKADNMAAFVGGKNKMLSSAHPSPFSANRGFFGNNHFIEINKHLKSTGQKIIDWNLPEII